MPPRSIRLLVVATLSLGAGLGVSGCSGAGRFLGELFRERPPSALDSMSVGEGSVIWGIIQPRGNVVVAAAEVEAPCR